MNLLILIFITGLLYFSGVTGYFAANASMSLLETTKKSDLEDQSQKIYTAILTRNQETTIQQTEPFGVIILKESLTRNNTLEYDLILYNIKDITGIFINYNHTIPLKTLYSNFVIPDICCISAEGSEAVNGYLTGILSNEFNVTLLDLLKNGVTMPNENIADELTQLDDNALLDENISPKNEPKSLTELFESGKAFISIETKSNLDEQLQGQIIDMVQILE
jgi:hypothetical protein